MSYFDDYEADILFRHHHGRARRQQAAEERDNATCKRCGAPPLNLRLDHNGKWSLFEKTRGEHNRNVPHQCNPTTPDDFEDLNK